MITETDYAYLAGLIDGDGCVLVRRRDHPTRPGDRERGPSYGLNLSIGGEPKHLTGLRELFGNVGFIYIRKKEGQRHLAEWTIAAKRGLVLLRLVVPYMRLKKAQAELALAMPMPVSRWGVTTALREKQESIRLEIKRLNTLGRGKKTQESKTGGYSDVCRTA